MQCSVIGHIKHRCDLKAKGGDTSCSKCVNAGRACATLIQVKDQPYLGWLPLPNAEQSEHLWGTLAYYIEHEEVEDEPPMKKSKQSSR